jgi:hypothetical protein
MPIAKNSGGDFTPLPAGSHVARCFAVISLGTQQSPMFPSSFKVMLMFEVPGETINIENKPIPMTIQKEYTLSLSEKSNLRRDLQSWRGREFTAKELEGFAVETVVGVPCMLSVIHKANAQKKTYANISSISGLPKGVQCPAQVHKSVKYEIEHGGDEVYNSLPEWIRKKIAMCGEWSQPSHVQQKEQSTAPEPETDDEESGDPEVPF